MASLGAVGVDIMRGTIPSLRTRTETWQMPGVDGYGAMTSGQGDSEFSVTVVEYGAESAVDTWIAAVEALQGTIITITDAHGDAFSNCFIKRVSRPRKRAVAGAYAARAEFRVEGVVRA